MTYSRPLAVGPGLVLALAFTARAAAADLVYADFEGPGYGGWITNGTAFGSAPAHGSWPGQAVVGGYRGDGLANSAYGGDAATGTLTSPEFVIDRPFIHFLIGGGARAGATCLNLRVEGRVVRTATGEDDEFMNTATWDVTDLQGRRAHLELVDQATGEWGHIQVDHIVFAGQAATPPLPSTAVVPAPTAAPGSNIVPRREPGVKSTPPLPANAVGSRRGSPTNSSPATR